jgi:xanthine/uracil permease
MIMFSGLDLIASAERTQRNTMIAGTTLGASVMIPYFVTTGGAAWAKTLPAFLNMFVNSNIFIAVVFGVVLNLLLNHLFKEKVKTPSGSEAASEKAESQESQESGG